VAKVLSDRMIKAVGEAIRECVGTFQGPGKFFIENEAGWRWDAENACADRPADVDWAARSYEIIAKAAIERALPMIERGRAHRYIDWSVPEPEAARAAH
jgi:hypothetical protein